MPFGCCFSKTEDVAFRGLPPSAAQEDLLETDEVLDLTNVVNQSVYDTVRDGKLQVDSLGLRVACIALKNLLVNQNVLDLKIKRESHKASLTSSGSMRPEIAWA